MWVKSLALAAIHPALQALLAVFVSLAAMVDFRSRRIPNALVLAGVVMGFVSQFVVFGALGLRAAALGLGLGFVLYFPLWLLHARGAGDVKLLAAAGTFLGPRDTLVLFVLAAVLGGVVALGFVLFKNRTRETAGNVAAILVDLLHFRRPAADVRDPRALRLPHAPVIALSTFAILAILHISQTHAPLR